MKLLSLLIAALVTLTAPSSGFGAGARVVVFLSHRAPPYEKALEGFKRYLAREGIEAKVDVYDLNGDAARVTEGIQALEKEKADLVYAVGSLAATRLARSTANVPLVASLILNSEPVLANPNAIAVSLDFSPETQFSWLSRLLPGIRNVGVLYGPDNVRKVEAAARVAAGSGLMLKAQKVSTPADLPAAMEALSKHVEVLWGMADDMVLTPQTGKQILLFAFRNSISFIGPSESWVKSGAIYSLDCDYEDVGEQSGELAAKILRREQLPRTRLVWPRKVTYSLNLNTALQMKIQFPESVIAGANRVYE